VPGERVVEALGDRAPSDFGSADEPTIALELGDLAQLKLAAISRHVSQTGSAGPFHDWDPAARDEWLSTEHYRLASSVFEPAAGGESSLFDGLG
jgi:hypothetical protein